MSGHKLKQEQVNAKEKNKVGPSHRQGEQGGLPCAWPAQLPPWSGDQVGFLDYLRNFVRVAKEDWMNLLRVL